MTLVPYEGEVRAPYMTPSSAIPQASPNERTNPTGLGFFLRGLGAGVSQFYQVSEDEREIWQAGFEQESPLVALRQALTRPRFEPDDSFNIQDRLGELSDITFDPFIIGQAQSNEEFDYLAARARQEQSNRNLLMSSGAPGVIAAMAGGTASPTVLLPGGSVAQGLRGGAQALRMTTSAAGWAMAGATIDEGILYLAQHQRTPEDVMLGIGSAGVLGGVFGAGAYLLSPRAIRRFEDDMAEGENREAIRILTPRTTEDPPARAAGADVPSVMQETDPGGTYFVGLDRALSFMSPTMRTLNQTVSATARRMQAQLGTGGLHTEASARGEAVARGGEIESRRNQWFTGMYEVMNSQHRLWNDYVTETPASARLNQADFFREVGRAMEAGTHSSIKQVDALAKIYREHVFMPLLEEAQRLGMTNFKNISLEDAMSYLPRMVKKGMLEQERLDLETILAEHFVEKSQAKMNRLLGISRRAQDREAQTLEDLGLSKEDAANLRAQLEEQMSNPLAQFPPSVQEIAREIRDLRALARGERTAEAKAMRAEAKRLEEENKELLKGFQTSERALKARFRALEQTRAGLAAQRRAALNKIEDIEELQLASVERANRALEKLREKVQKGEANLDKEIARAEATLRKAYATWEKQEARLDKLRQTPEGFAELEMADLRPTEKISRIESGQVTRKAQLDELLAGLEELTNAGTRTELLEAIKAQKKLVSQKMLRTNNRRAVRRENLRRRADELDPARNTVLQKELKERLAAREARVLKTIRENLGGELPLRLKPGTDEAVPYGLTDADLADFTASARQDARRIISSMAGEGKHMPAMVQVGERGSQLERTLDIDPEKVWSNGRRYEEFLERNIERVARNYTRQMSTDVELHRVFGSVNPLANDAYMAGKMRDEFYSRLEEIKTDESLTPRQRDKATRQAEKEYKNLLEDLGTQIERLRYHRGVPDDPSALSYRLGRSMLNLNVLRFMGGTVGQSIPDVASVVMKSGTLNNFGKAIRTLATDFKGFQASALEIKYSGAAMDLIVHGRMSAMFDVMDEVEHGTMAERGLQWATNKFGLVSGMDHYNTGMKHFSGVITNFRLVAGIDGLVNGGISRAERAYLAANGIDEGWARLMWDEMNTPGGGTKVDGVLLPNTESWQSPELAASYRAAVGRMINTMVVTPGIERPSFMDQNMWTRLLTQFRSFTASSTTRILLAGMQEARLGNVMPVMVGSMMSIALGAMAFGIYALNKPAERRGELLNSSPEVWVNEAINRSGLLGALGEVKNLGEQIPATRRIATLGAEIPGSSAFSTPLGRMAGPTVGLLTDVETLGVQFSDMLAGRDDADFREREQNALRRLLPYQNLHFLSLGFNALQEQM